MVGCGLPVSLFQSGETNAALKGSQRISNPGEERLVGTIRAFLLPNEEAMDLSRVKLPEKALALRRGRIRGFNV